MFDHQSVFLAVADEVPNTSGDAATAKDITSGTSPAPALTPTLEHEPQEKAEEETAEDGEVGKSGKDMNESDGELHDSDGEINDCKDEIDESGDMKVLDADSENAPCARNPEDKDEGPATPNSKYKLTLNITLVGHHCCCCFVFCYFVLLGMTS